MKCDYCLEEIQEGAAACPHCTREQLWSIQRRDMLAQEEIQAKREQNAGCMAKVLIGVVLVFVAIFFVASFVGDIERHENELREFNRQAAEYCPIFVSSGDFVTIDACVDRARAASLDLYASSLTTYCGQRREKARLASEDCSSKRDGVKACKRLSLIAASAADIAACAVSERAADRRSGITIDKGWNAPKYASTTP